MNKMGTLDLMQWKKRSDNELLDAIDNIIDYTDVAQDEIYLEAEKRGLLNKQHYSYVLNQIRSRIEGPGASIPIHEADVSQASKLRSRMVFGPRLLFSLGFFQVLIGILGVLANNQGDEIIHLAFGGLNLLIGLLIYKQARQATSLALMLVGIQTLLWGIMVFGQLFYDRKITSALTVVFFLLGTFIIESTIASLRYNKKVKIIQNALNVSVMPLQARYFQNWKNPLVALVLFGSISCFLVGLFLFVYYLQPPPLIVSPEWLKMLIRLTGCALALLGSPYLWSLARRLATLRSHELSRKDVREQILYVRSFGDDKIKYSTISERVIGFLFPLLRFFMRRTTFEESLVWSLSAYGPVVAIGEPGLKLPPVGAAREHIDGDMWRETVRDLICRSATVIAVLGNTPGLVWELNQIRELASLHKLLLIIPPVDRKQLSERLEVFSNVLPEFACISFQSILDSGLILMLQADNMPAVISSMNRDEADYIEGLRHAISYILQKTREDTSSRNNLAT